MKSVFRPRSTLALVLTALAVVPALLVFLVSAVGLYFAFNRDVERDVQERGRLTSRALAEGATFAVVSGNTAGLSNTLASVGTTDRAVASIAILDQDRRELSAYRRVGPPMSQAPLIVEQVIRVPLATAEMFDKTSPQLGAAAGTSGGPLLGPVAGYVVVALDVDPIARERFQRVALAAAVVASVAAAAVGAGLVLAWRVRRPLGRILAALRAVEGGDYSVDLGPPARGEIGELQQRIAAMTRGVREATAELEAKVRERTAELQTAAEAASRAEQARRALLAKSTDAVEEERRRIATEIHDDLGATLSLIVMNAQRIESGLSEGASLSNDQVMQLQAVAKAITTNSRRAYTASRGIAKSMHPEVIDTIGLARSLADLVNEYDRADSYCRFSYSTKPGLPLLRGPRALALYRVAQEAMTNITKHAQATEATVCLDANEKNVVLRIMDNGVGFDQAKAAAGLGVMNMSERMDAVGGSFSIRSVEGNTQIVAALPLREDI